MFFSILVPAIDRYGPLQFIAYNEKLETTTVGFPTVRYSVQYVYFSQIIKFIYTVRIYAGQWHTNLCALYFITGHWYWPLLVGLQVQLTMLLWTVDNVYLRKIRKQKEINIHLSGTVK